MKKFLTYESCGLGLFWAWCYCLWFIPNIYANTDLVYPGKNYSWLIVLASAAFIQFLVPFCLKTRRLSSYPFLYILTPALLFFGTLGIEASSWLPSSSEVPYCVASVISGIASAFLWHLWGDRYASSKNCDGEGVAFGFGVVVLACVIATSLLPRSVSGILVALIPIASGVLLQFARCKNNSRPLPKLLPKASRKTSISAIVKVCLISFATCTVCTFNWATISMDELSTGFLSLPLGVALGAIFMLAAALPKIITHESSDIARILSWVLFFATVAVALRTTGNSQFLTISYLLSLATSVVIDVLLATYFVALVVKGYVASTTAFGYSEGFICLAMLFGNLLANMLTAFSWHQDEMLIREVFVFATCIVVLMLILLNQQENDIRTIMNAPLQASAIERNYIAMAEEFKLSNKEFEILELLGQGYNARNIANRLVISVHTVQTHIKHIYAKMNIHNRTELIEYINLRKNGTL